MTELIAPTVEMLWESTDPRVALRDRFGFTDPGVAARWVAGVLANQFGIGAGRCERIVMSDRNAMAWVETSDGQLVAKWSVARDRFRRLAALAELMCWLDVRGLPVSAPIRAADGRPQIEIGDVSLGVQHKVSGTLLDVDDLAQVHAAGATLAHLHSALAAYELAVPDLRAPSRSLREQVIGWLDSCPGQVPLAARRTLRELLPTAYDDRSPGQLVHGDYRSANILWSGNEITAVLDFEEARFDHRIVELARSAVLLGTRFHDWGPVSAEVCSTLRAGYESEQPLTPDESMWWDALVLWHSLMMIPEGDDPTGWSAAAMSRVREL